ncbi:MAG: ribonuclease P protein subunit [Candidatus Thermoplasmatota archaeon]|jgi:RNase P/RNase MRP subunit p29|nr:ribonuclease P protein subunit [Candidatus Thermoplasmatota archaeon]MCL5790237.1 ribonuclease P protein subunit [Candidatus Thermoplasmatota archaeon]
MNPTLTDVLGSKVVVISHTDPSMVGMTGTVVDERRNILKLETGRGLKTLPKTSGILLINDQRVDLGSMRFRPEDKMKKIRRKGRQ